jgi:hypothetical protein
VKTGYQETNQHFRMRRITQNAIDEVGRTILNVEVLEEDINSDPNASYGKLSSALTEALSKHMPIKLVRYNKQRHKGSPWITNAILNSMEFDHH